jgi:hypothetical protein
MKAKRRFFSFLMIFCLAVALNAIAVRADTAGNWAPDARVPGYLDDTFTPFLLADQNRTIHAFTSQWVQSLYKRRAIVYRRWTAVGGWTRPVDILLAPAGDANFLGAYLDSASRLHVIFTADVEGDLGVYYSQAAATEADWAPAWSKPILIGENVLSEDYAAIAGDAHGNLFVIYSGGQEGNGVYFVSCAATGGNWSEPLPVFLTQDLELLPVSLKLAAGPENQIHAAWAVITSGGVDEALYFANYNIEESEWTTPVELDHRIDLRDAWGPSYPMMVDNGTDIVILYNGGNPLTGQYVARGRPVMRASISGDGGLTWRGPINLFPLLTGRSGEHALAMDSAGGVHGLFIMRIDQLINEEYKPIGGIWHSTYRNGIWSSPERMVTTINPHDIRGIVVQGNVFLVVWREDPGDGKAGIWFTYTLLDAPELPVVPLSTVPAAVSTGVLPTTSPPLPTASPLLETNVLSEAPLSRWMSNPAFPIIAGALPVFLLVIGILVVHRLSNDRKE